MVPFTSLKMVLYENEGSLCQKRTVHYYYYYVVVINLQFSSSPTDCHSHHKTMATLAISYIRSIHTTN